MNNNFQKVKKYLLELNCHIVLENEGDGIFIIDNDENGINKLVIGCSEPLLIMEQFLFDIVRLKNSLFLRI